MEYVTGSVYGQSGSVGQEAVVSLFRTVAGQVVRGGFGWGIGNGISTPKYRFLLSVQPHKRVEKDSDKDGILDVDDQCPNIPEDMDGIRDDDGCVDLTEVSVICTESEIKKFVTDASWTVGEQSGGHGDSFSWQVLDSDEVEINVTAKGYQAYTGKFSIVNGDTADVVIELIADTGTLFVKAVDEIGNPVEAAWVIKGRKPKFKMAGKPQTLNSGDYNIQVRAKGFKPVTKSVTIETGSEAVVEVTLMASLANVDGNKISIDDSVYFETGSAVILDKSHKLLDDVAHILVEHPSITELEIEGHTDNQGDDASNKTSQKRADSVKAYLIQQGITENRLHAIGYGEEKPIVGNDTEEGRAQNRRVHFHIAEQDHSKEHHETEAPAKAVDTPVEAKPEEAKSTPEEAEQ